MADRVLTGGCLCGAVRYRTSGTPTWAGHCHCSLCRKATGAAYVSWFTVPAADFVFTAGTPATFASSPTARRQHCPTCGTQLTFRYNDKPTQLDVTIASLDDPAAIPPAENVWWPDRVEPLLNVHALPQRKAGSAG